MPRIENTIAIFAILLIGINLMFMFLTTLPSNSSGTEFYQFGLPQSKQDEIENNMKRLESDMNAIGQSTGVGVTGTTTENTNIDFLGAILAGIGLAINAPSLIINLVNFFLLAVFGWIYWIDYFFAPLVIMPFGSGFTWIAWIIKGIFFVVQLVGLSYMLIMFYSGFRRT